MKKFIKKTLVKCNIEELFDFHMNTNNIMKITPKEIKIELLTKNFVPKLAEVLNLKVTKCFIPMLWSIEISLIDRPHIMVDTAKKSPFKFWRHSHIFTPREQGCELKDIIEYELPFGFLGELLSTKIENSLQGTFDYRHKMTKFFLETL